jgi:hypothetical protein
MRPRHLTDLPKLHFAESCASNFAEAARRWGEAFAMRRDEPMDAATMRDLAITESELGSIEAESKSLVERTRLRVLSVGQ